MTSSEASFTAVQLAQVEKLPVGSLRGPAACWPGLGWSSEHSYERTHPSWSTGEGIQRIQFAGAFPTQYRCLRCHWGLWIERGMPVEQGITANFSSVIGCQYFGNKFPYSCLEEYPRFSGYFGWRILLVLILQLHCSWWRQYNLPNIHFCCLLDLYFSSEMKPGNFLLHDFSWKNLEDHCGHIDEHRSHPHFRDRPHQIA